MADDLRVVGRLPGQTLHGISFGENLGFGHDLDLLRGVRYAVKGVWQRRYGPVHQLRLGIEGVVKQSLQRIKLLFRCHRIGPDPADLPNVDLAIGDYV